MYLHSTSLHLSRSSIVKLFTVKHQPRARTVLDMPKVQIGRPVRRFRRRRTLRRRVRRGRVMRPSRALRYNTVHRFVRKCRVTSLVVPALGNGYYGYSYAPTLNLVPNYTEYQVLYDQFRIDYVKLWFVARGSTLSMIESYNTQQLGMPEVVSCVDHDDINAPTSDEAGMNDLRERGRSKCHSFTAERRAFSVGWKPNTLTQLFRSSTPGLDGYKASYGWLDVDYASTPHYGFKAVFRVPFTGGTMPADYTFDVFATYYLRFKDTR